MDTKVEIAATRHACVRLGRPWMLGSSLLFLVLPANALLPVVPSASRKYFQQSGSGAPLGKLNVSSKMMAGNCITMVSPEYPQTTGAPPKASTVVVRVVVWASGKVTPMRVVSGQPSLQDEAMNVVRLWKYRPFVQNDFPVDVSTDIRVEFDPSKPGGVVTHPNH